MYTHILSIVLFVIIPCPLSLYRGAGPADSGSYTYSDG